MWPKTRVITILSLGLSTVPQLQVCFAITGCDKLPGVSASGGFGGTSGHGGNAGGSGSGGSGGKAWGVPTRIETDNTAEAKRPDVALDGSGNAIAVWHQFDDTRYTIWANRYVTGTGWGPATLIETNNARFGNGPHARADRSGGATAVRNHITGPQVAMNGSGNAIAVWYQSDDAGSTNIWANAYVGSGWGSATLIETDDSGYASDPQVAVDGSGNAIAMWYQFDGMRSNIWANRYVTGSGWGSATLIETDNAGGATDPQVAVDSNGNFTAVWTQSDGMRDNIWASRYVTGSGWGTPTLIETDNAGDDGNAIFPYPQVAVDGSGNATAVWAQTDGMRTNIWANRYVTGSGWGTATLIETDNSRDAQSPEVAVDGSGNATAVWFQSDGMRDNIWANRYVAGSGWGTATLIKTDKPGYADGPQVAVDRSGNAVVVWYQSDDIRTNIWANRYVIGLGWGTATLIETDDAEYAASPQIAVDGSGNATAVWYQSDGTRTHVWANRFQ